jgi:hypothetical protein
VDECEKLNAYILCINNKGGAYGMKKERRKNRGYFG